MTVIDDRPDVDRGGLGRPETCQLRVMDRTGDTAITWARGNTTDKEIARKAFGKAKKAGYLAYQIVTRQGREEREQVHSFDEVDPDAEKVIMTSPLQGG